MVFRLGSVVELFWHILAGLVKYYSGKLMVRMPVEVHEAVATTAEVNGKSINQWIVETLEEAAG